MLKLNGWKMLADYMLVKESDPITQSEGGIVYAETAARNDPTGTILAVGPDAGPDFPVGGAVMFTPTGGFPTFVGDDEYLVLQPKHIVAVRESLASVASDPSNN